MSLAACALGLAAGMGGSNMTLAQSWPSAGADLNNSHFQAAETQISPKTAANLRLKNDPVHLLVNYPPKIVACLGQVEMRSLSWNCCIQCGYVTSGCDTRSSRSLCVPERTNRCAFRLSSS
jgi:hypothetical protein